MGPPVYSVSPVVNNILCIRRVPGTFEPCGKKPEPKHAGYGRGKRNRGRGRGWSSDRGGGNDDRKGGGGRGGRGGGGGRGRGGNQKRGNRNWELLSIYFPVSVYLHMKLFMQIISNGTCWFFFATVIFWNKVKREVMNFNVLKNVN